MNKILVADCWRFFNSSACCTSKPSKNLWPDTLSANGHWQNLGKNFCLIFVFCLMACAIYAAPPLKKWNGGTSTDWATAANWTPNAVPIAGDSVYIPSGTTYQPVIFSGTLGKAKNTIVEAGTSLTINAGGSLELASSLNVNGLGVLGSVTNNGTLVVKSGFHGIDVYGNLINNGTIRLGEATSNPYAFTEEGIRMFTSGANFNNSSTGTITIVRPGNNGILLFTNSPVFTNSGKITVRNAGMNPATVTTADGIDAKAGSFTNEATGQIVISGTLANGLNSRLGGSFTNKGDIKIGNVDLGGINVTTNFTNTATGKITIDTCSNNGILNQGTFSNSGIIAIGEAKANSIGNNALGNLGTFNNYNGATIRLKNAKIGILGGGLGGTLTNYAGATITIGQMVEDGVYQFGFVGTNNFGTLNIGSTGSIGGHAINNACQFLNQFGAEVNITNTADTAIVNTTVAGVDGLFNNVGKITVDNAANGSKPAIRNTVNCTFENLSCTALLHITSNNAIHNLGTFNNEGNIIENASGNSSITDNSGVIQNLNGGTFSVTGSDTGINTDFVGAIWKGCADTNWAIAINWNDLAVPVASEDVLITDRSNDPTIFSPTAAVAKSVLVENSAALTLNTGSSLTISGATGTALRNKSTVTNNGLITINNAGYIGIHTDSQLDNNETGEITINGTGSDGILQGNAVTNFGKIKIGNTGNIAGFGINKRHGNFQNKNTGELTIDQTGDAGILNFDGGITNAGKLTIGGIANIGGEGIVCGAPMSNSTGGTMLIDRTTGSGLSISFGLFNNSATLKIGSTASIGGIGISCQNGTLNNFAGGEIAIDRTTYDGIYNYYGAFFKAINNSGKIFIGKNAAIGRYGIQNEARFINNSDGEITIDRTGDDGIYVRDDNDGNTTPAVFNNSGKITVGGIANITGNGIRNGVTFNNNAGGDIKIDRTSSDGLRNSAGAFSNTGLLTIGATTAPTGDGLENAATFNNQACGEIALHDNLNNEDAFTNTGLLRMNTALAHTNSGTFANDGIIEYPQGSLIPTVTNNDVIVKAVTGECPVANALDLGGSNSFTIGTTWYKDANLTMSAGTYNQAANDFTVTGLPEGSTNTLYFTVSDGTNGCTRTVSIRLTYDDVTKPTIACPANMTLNTDDDGGADCAVTVNYTATFSDNCDGTGPATYVSGPISGTSLSVNGSPYTIVYTYTDMGGNTVANNCTFTVTVKDNTKPTFTCPNPPLVLNTTGATGCSVNIPNLVDMVPNEADNCALRATNPVTQSVPAGAYTGAAHGQQIPVTVTVWDNASPVNSTACTITFTVNDDDAPSIMCPSNIIRSTDAGQCTAVVGYGLPTYADNCTADIQRTRGLASGSIFPRGTSFVEWKATDGAGLTATCQFSVTINDVQAPTINCPANIVRNNDAGQCGAVITYTNPTYSDNCEGAGLDHLSGGISGSPFPKGTTTVVWMATDASNNTATCSFSITVNDTERPNITCPANIAKGTDAGVCSAIVTYSLPTRSDNCDLLGLDLLSGGTSGSSFPKGTTTVVWMVTDLSNNTRTCSFRVIVNDTQAPTFTNCPNNQTVPTAQGTCASAPVTYATPAATDNCGTVTVVRIGGPVSGSTFPAGNTVVTWRAIDGSSRSSTCTFTVTVTDNEPPVINCPSSVVTTGSGTPCTATAFYATPTASDNCAGALTPFLVSGLGNGSNYPAGITTNVWRAVTSSGQSSECTFTVTVNCPGSRANTTSGTQFKQNTSDALALSLSPNPSKGMVWFVVSGALEQEGVLIAFDALGRAIWQQVLTPDQPIGQFDVSGWTAGMYQICVRTNSQALTKALMVSGD